MENAWREQKALINELTQGMELVRQLSFHLNSASMDENQQLLLQRILSSYEKSLLILQWSGSPGLPPQPAAPATTGMPEFSPSPDGSPRSEEFDKGGFKDQSDASKKRKVLPIWTNQVRVCTENRVEGPIGDGYSWRKYGQKDILGAKYPRSYYRCTYRNVQNCWATKQVQRSDEDPSVFEITYKGKHTCNQRPHTTNSDPNLAEKQELKQNKQYINNYQQQQPSDILSNLRANLRVNTENLDENNELNMAAAHFTFPLTSFPFPSDLDQNNPLGVYPPTFISPATSGSNYFPVPSWEANGFGVACDLPLSESDPTEIISANNSVANSPITRLDFSLENFGPKNNPFDNAGFFA